MAEIVFQSDSTHSNPICKINNYISLVFDASSSLQLVDGVKRLSVHSNPPQLVLPSHVMPFSFNGSNSISSPPNNHLSKSTPSDFTNYEDRITQLERTIKDFLVSKPNTPNRKNQDSTPTVDSNVHVKYQQEVFQLQNELNLKDQQLSLANKISQEKENHLQGI